MGWEVGEGGGRREEVGGGRWVVPNRTAPTDTSSKETAGNANRTEPNRNTHDSLPGSCFFTTREGCLLGASLYSTCMASILWKAESMVSLGERIGSS